ncbi:MAG: asparagine synthase (glutamine-hydrolyzing) [Bacteroidota bacterium]
MCGINGLVSAQITDVHKEAVRKMCAAMAHRGPDAEGVWTGDNAVFGHRRLSIIDLSIGANQPFLDPTGRYILVYNGELYNYRELKNELVDFPYKTESDTEVVLAALIKWDIEAFSRFNGMFAIACWDKVEKRLLLARDRLGIKPLYFSQRESELIFSSEIGALLKSSQVSEKIRSASLQDFFTYQTVHAPHTLLREVSQLMPGEYGIWKDGDFRRKMYWRLGEQSPKIEESKEAIQKGVRERLTEAVRKRMVSDVPLGAFLSGGIDSSAVVALMASISNKPVHTFSIGFEEREFDESPYAQQIAKKFRTDHRQIRLNPLKMLEDLPEALAAMDSPSADGINSYLVSKYTRKAGLKVALSGLGGDELFAGYPVFKYWHKLLQYQRLWNTTAFARKLAAGYVERLVQGNQRTRLREILQISRLNLPEVYPIFRKLQVKEQLEELLRLPESGNNMPTQLLTASASSWENLSELSKISWAEISTYTQNVLLRDADQMSMAHGLEVRVPFFDHELIEYVMGIPDDIKYPYSPKELLVSSLEDLLPDEVVNRKKMGFVFPWKHWMKNELREFCQTHIDSLLEREWIQSDTLRTQWNDFKIGKESISWIHMWQLIVIESWLGRNGL